MNNLNRLFTSQIRSISESDRTAEFIISSERRDRHRTILDIDGWILDSYYRNPVVAFQHDAYADTGKPDPDSIIGKSEVFKDFANRLLIGRVTFEPKELNPLANKVFLKILNGTLRAASVGFLPLEPGRWGKGDEAQNGARATYYYGRRELLEWSIVSIPSNSDATLRSLDRLEPFTGDQGKQMTGEQAAKLVELEIRLAEAGLRPRKVTDLEKFNLLKRLSDTGLYKTRTKR